jgi:AbrB family looped-hinge helix DNA binding protein
MSRNPRRPPETPASAEGYSAEANVWLSSARIQLSAATSPPPATAARKSAWHGTTALECFIAVEARRSGQAAGGLDVNIDAVPQVLNRVTGIRWYRVPMESVVDQAGRIVLPKPIRDALGLLPGTKVDITPYGAGAQVLPAGRTARLVEENGVLVADADTQVDDGIVFALIDAGRK